MSTTHKTAKKKKSIDKSKKVRVVIIGSQKPSYWYADKIGNTYSVYPDPTDSLCWLLCSNSKKFICKSDTTIVKKP